jgi:hypothetical protein
MPYVPKAPCVHEHLNGAPCQQTSYTQSGLCGLHRGRPCTECESMMAVFVPRRGWIRSDEEEADGRL